MNVSIFTIINNTNNHLAPQIIHQEKITTKYGFGNSDHGLGQTQAFNMVKPISVTQIPL